MRRFGLGGSLVEMADFHGNADSVTSEEINRFFNSFPMGSNEYRPFTGWKDIGHKIVGQDYESPEEAEGFTAYPTQG
jgi:hypothetical protein